MSRRLRLSGGAALAIVLVALGAGVTYAAFVATSSNSGNSFQAAACFSTQRIATGSYTGNAPTDNRSISVGFQPDLVIVKADTAQIAVARTSSMSGDASKRMSGANSVISDRIQSLSSSGFTIGTNAQVNQNGTSYRWIAFKSGCGTLKVGSYAGNGGASQTVTGVGFQPELVMVMSQGPSQPMQRFSGMTTSFRFDGGAGTANVINSLDADGFTVGNAAEANTNGTTYHYVAFNDVVGSVNKGSYTGSGVDNRNISTVGFQPDYLMIRANDTATVRSGHHRPASLTGGNSLFWAATGNSNNGIQALQANGFQVGTDGSVNANGPTYHYLALKNTGGGCSLPGPQTVQASADTWLDEAAPNSNFGPDTVLKVTSKGPSNDTRAVLKFNLPTIPSDCSVVGATLRLNNQSPVSGRAIEVLRIDPNDAAWTENGVDWTNQPATTGSAATATTPASAGWMQWDVTSQVQAMYSSTNGGFKVKDQTEDGAGFEQQFGSREASTNRPVLVVTVG